MQIVTAYRQLNPAQRSFVDGVVSQLEFQAERRNERISQALTRDIPANIVQSDTRGLLGQPLVTSAISERVIEIARDREFSPLRVVKEMTTLALSNMGDYYTVDDNGVPIFDLTKLTPEQKACIKSIEIEDSGDGIIRPGKRKFKFTLHDKIAPLKMLAQIAGLLENDSPARRDSRAADTVPQISPSDSVESAGEKYAAMLEGGK